MGEPESSVAGLPGGDLVADGVRDIAAGRRTVPALLVAQATSRPRPAST